MKTEAEIRSEIKAAQLEVLEYVRGCQAFCMPYDNRLAFAWIEAALKWCLGERDRCCEDVPRKVEGREGAGSKK